MSVSPEQRIAELEARVRQLSDIVACIPLAAAGLRLIPLASYTAAMESPLEAMRVLERIAERAEISQELISNFGVEDSLIQALVAQRRQRMEIEISGRLMHNH